MYSEKWSEVCVYCNTYLNNITFLYVVLCTCSICSKVDLAMIWQVFLYKNITIGWFSIIIYLQPYQHISEYYVIMRVFMKLHKMTDSSRGGQVRVASGMLVFTSQNYRFDPNLSRNILDCIKESIKNYSILTDNSLTLILWSGL
jgi:hypothetical protein